MKKLNKSVVLLSTTLSLAGIVTPAINTLSVSADSNTSSSESVSSNGSLNDMMNQMFGDNSYVSAQNFSKNTSNISLDQQSNRIEPFVRLNKKTNNYYLIENAKSNLSSNDYKIAIEYLLEANETINSYKNNKSEVLEISDPQSDQTYLLKNNELSKAPTEIQTRSKYHAGVTKVTVHWNYVRVYLSKSVANTLKGGSVIAVSQYLDKVPNKYVKLLAGLILGALDNLEIKGGVWFDFNYYSSLLDKQGWQ